MKNPPRRIKARKDLRYFCTEYFPAKFKLKFSSYHEKVIKTFQKELIEGKEKVALAMPRGSGKTTLVQTAVIWAVLFGHCRFIVVIGASKADARKIIDNIKADLIGNKRLLEDFPEAICPLRKLGGSALQARGQRYLGELTNVQWKPDMVALGVTSNAIFYVAKKWLKTTMSKKKTNEETMPETAGNESDTLPETSDEVQAETAATLETAVSYPPCRECGGESKPVGEPIVTTYRNIEIITKQLVKCSKCGLARWNRSTEKYTPASRPPCSPN